jgi:hypothetical protein
MDEWMDGWMSGWVDEWMDGLKFLNSIPSFSLAVSIYLQRNLEYVWVEDHQQGLTGLLQPLKSKIEEPCVEDEQGLSG